MKNRDDKPQKRIEGIWPEWPYIGNHIQIKLWHIEEGVNDVHIVDHENEEKAADSVKDEPAQDTTKSHAEA